jgi:hypothetical protein
MSVALVLSLPGCNCGMAEPGADAGPDGGGATDAGHDAGTVDAGAPDAGAPDAGAPDAGAPDAGAPDSGAPDAGPARDDAGCPLPTGLVLDPAAAGLPDAGLALWLRGDLGVATLPDGSVCRWEDLSGQGHDFFPGTATRPRHLDTGLRGWPAVSFSGPNQFLSRSGALGLPATAGRTVALIGLTSDTTRRFQYFIQGVGGTPGTYFGPDMNTFSTAGSKEGVYVTNNAYDADLATAAQIRTHVFSISSFAPGGVINGLIRYWVSGVQRTLTRTPGGLGNGTVESFSSANFTAIGAGYGAFTGALLGDLLVYDHALTDPERLAVEAYFQARYPD